MHPTLVQAELLYEKDPLVKRDDVKILQEWLTKQPHLPQIEESQVIIFLHSCYYSIQASKSTIDAYFTRRTRHPEIFHCPNEHVIRSSMSTSFLQVLPKRTPEDYFVLLVKLREYSVENYSFLNDVRVMTVVQTLEVHQHGLANGLVVLFDWKGYSLSHLTRVNLSALKNGLQYVQEGAPMRIKQIHYVNVVPFMDRILGLIKPFMSSDLYNMIQLHSSFDSVYEHVPKGCLPEDYGGELPSCQVLQDENLGYILKNLDFLEWHDSQKVDESKRMGQHDSAFGTEGTFKKLDID